MRKPDRTAATAPASQKQRLREQHLIRERRERLREGLRERHERHGRYLNVAGRQDRHWDVQLAPLTPNNALASSGTCSGVL